MLSPGTILGTYEITSHLGSGGMGDVYQAHDSKLGRDVAIKVLPEQFARDAVRLARFQREARMLAALNHPNIAAIYGLEESGGIHYLVMELVPGQTLRERTANEHPLPVEEALAIARQIAEALEAAHESSIIHRDLKPANVKVTPASRVKVLDFGLAKAFAPETPVDDTANSPTLSTLPTQHGIIMGTAAYMSPEQARGRTITKATDIWAFGCVFYELLTGRAAFAGEDVTEILAAVVMKEPDWSRLPDATPPTMHTLLRHCLRKDRRQRLQDATDVRIQIEDALTAPSADATQAAAAKKMRAIRLRWLAFALSLGLLAAGVAALAVWNMKPATSSAPQPVSRFTIALPEGDSLAGLDLPAVAVSSDGSQLAYVATRGGIQQLFLRAMDGLEPRPVPGTEGASVPFFSPDGQWLGFVAERQLKKVAIKGGGTALPLGEAALPRGATWTNHGTIIFGRTGPTGSVGLQEVSDSGGAPQMLNRTENGESSHRWPDLLPGGNAVVFTAGNNDAPRIAVQPIGAPQPRDLIPGATYPRYAPSGHLVYMLGGSLMAVPFDPERLQVTGTAVPLVEGVMQDAQGGGGAQFALSATGSLVYVPGSAQAASPSSLVWVSRNGTEQPVPAPARAYRGPRISPDGARIAAAIETQVWLYDFLRQTLTRVTFEGRSNTFPVWTPDGQRIALRTSQEGPPNLFSQPADGTGGLERLATSEYVQTPGSWSPDGRLLAFGQLDSTGRWNIWILRMDDRKAEPFIQTPSNEVMPRFSSDGRWLAYASDESGRLEIYVQPYPGPGGKWQVSTEGGIEPVWNPNGRELFYRSGGKMMAVEITTQPSVAVGKPRMLFEGPYMLPALALATYDVSPDGQRFLMLKPIDQAPPTRINVVLNWFEELKRLVPAAQQ